MKNHIQNWSRSSCQGGKHPETVDHILWSCDLYNKHRKKLYKGLQKESIIILIAMNDIKVYEVNFNFF